MSKKMSSGMGHKGGHPRGPVQKPKEFKKTLLRLTGYLKPRKFQLIIVLIAAIGSTVFNVVSPKLLGDATSSLFESFTQGTGVQFDVISRILLLLVLLYVVASLFSFVQQYVMAGVSQQTIAELRQEANDKLTRLPLRYFDKTTHGDTLSRVMNDIDNINTSLQQALTQVITSVITVIGIVVMMLFISPLLTLPLSLFAIRGITSFSQKHFKAQQKELGMINGHINEMFTGHQTVRAYGYEKKAIDTFDQLNEQLYESSRKAQFISGLMMPMMTFIGNLGYVAVSVAGGILVINGNIRVGDVQAFIQYTQQMSQPLVQASSVANLVQSAIASAERVFEILDEEEEHAEEDAAIDIKSLSGDVAFEHVHFGYEKDQPIIKDLNLQVREGQTVAIVGPTGAGKTTIINLLMRFYELDQGSIRIGGVKTTDLSREQVRDLFAMVLQDTWLFEGTIYDNIAYGRPNVSKEDVLKAAKHAYADDFIRTLPDGYDTLLTEDAGNLSQGQRQLLTIARAILSDPKILILDEATSSVDTRTEMHIQKAMNELMNGRTSFVIAHRLSTIKDADLILVMKDGTIIEKGTHRELLKEKGFYADLYMSQFAENQVG
ncbi:ABC transporter ATP-binding protein [Bacillus altitudinis]|uniref:ABC transporter ATP-binding protein n=1 Tax=Bacillus altitudinis TaxID=293387 RepID=UPI0030C86881